MGKNTVFILFGQKWSSKPIVTGIKERAAMRFMPLERPGYKEDQAESENQTGSFELTHFRIHFFPVEPSDKSGNSRD